MVITQIEYINHEYFIQFIFNLFEDMSFDSFGKSFSTNLQVSRDPKKSVLWNNIEPGDPYDIRKYSIKLIQIHDRKITRRIEKLHGRSHRNGLSFPSRRNLETY